MHPTPAEQRKTLKEIPLYEVPVAVRPKPARPCSCGAVQHRERNTFVRGAGGHARGTFSQHSQIQQACMFYQNWRIPQTPEIPQLCNVSSKAAIAKFCPTFQHSSMLHFFPNIPKLAPPRPKFFKSLIDFTHTLSFSQIGCFSPIF